MKNLPIIEKKLYKHLAKVEYFIGKVVDLSIYTVLVPHRTLFNTYFVCISLSSKLFNIRSFTIVYSSEMEAHSTPS